MNVPCAVAFASLGGLWCGDAFAQAEPVALCPEGIPEALMPEMRLEFAARGHVVALRCDATEGWTVGVESRSLSEVWVVVRRDGRSRRSRVPRAIDVIDGRALAIAAATLLEEQDPGEASEEGPTASETSSEASHETARSESTASSATASNETASDETASSEGLREEDHVTSVSHHDAIPIISSRALTQDLVVLLGVAGVVGRLEERHGGVGGLLAVGRHLRASTRFDAGLVMSGWSQRILLGLWVGLTRVWRPEARTWIEVGGALRYAQDVKFEGGARIGVGAETHVALQRKAAVAGRFFLRLSAAPLVYLVENPRFGVESVLSLGWVITP